MTLPAPTTPAQARVTIVAAMALLIALGAILLIALAAHHIKHSAATTAPRNITLQLPIGCAPPTEPGDVLHLTVEVDNEGTPATRCTARRIPRPAS